MKAGPPPPPPPQNHKVTRKKIEFFQNTSKLVSKDASGAGEYCPVVFVSIFLTCWIYDRKTFFFGIGFCLYFVKLSTDFSDF